MTRRRSRALLPLALAVLAATPARGADPPATPDSQGATGAAPGEDTWVDAGHGAVERWVFSPLFRLDRFFSDEREIEPERETSFVRWRNEVFFAGDRSRPAFTTGLRATLQLPWLNARLRRLRIVLAGETRDAVSALFPKPPGPNGVPAPGTPGAPAAPEDDAVGNGDAGLRFYLVDSLFAHADLGGGILVQLPPGAYAQLRLRWAIPVGTLFLTRTAVIGFWRTDERLGTRATVELERPIARRLFARVAGAGMVSQRSDGLEWGSELALVAPFPPRSAAQVGYALEGASAARVSTTDPVTGVARVSPVPGLARSRVYARLRRDVYRRWLFLEIEPEVAWPWSAERGRYATWGFTFRFEVQFQARPPARPAAPPAAPEPEPPDPPEPADPAAPAPPPAAPGGSSS